MSIHQFHLLKSASIQSRTSHVKFGSSPCIVFFLRLFCRAVCQSTAKLAPGEVTRVQNAKIALLDFDLKKFRLGMNVEIKVTETPRPCTAGSATIRTDFQRQYPDTFEGTQSSDYYLPGRTSPIVYKCVRPSQTTIHEAQNCAYNLFSPMPALACIHILPDDPVAR